MNNANSSARIRALASAALLITGAAAQAAGVFEAPLPAGNPCSILTSFEVSAAVGMSVQQGAILFGSGSTVGCSFARVGGDRVALLVLRVASAEWLAEQADRMHHGSILGSYLQVDTIGERAFLFGNQSARPVLCVFKSPYYLQLSTPGVTNDQQNRALQTLARAVLRRLTPDANLRADGGPNIRPPRQ